MANILFSAASNILWDNDNPNSIDSFYESFIDQLLKYGNKVLFFRTNNIIDQNFNENKCTEKNNQKILNQLSRFVPDLIITANHSIPQVVLDCTTAPVIILNTDSPFYYSGQDYIKQHIDRYIFAHQDRCMFFVDTCIKLFGGKRSQHFYVGYATAIQNEKRPVINNIVFIGSVGWTNIAKESFCKCLDQKDFAKFLDNFDRGTNLDDPCNVNKNYLFVLTSNSRIKILDALSDLGLKVHGLKYNFVNVLPFSMNLIRCYDFKMVYKTKDVQNVYNSSLIAPTLPNMQQKSGLSWRSLDIMASNACLICPSSNEDLKIVSPYVKIPTYDSPQEARLLCQKLMKDKIWRKEIIKGSNKSINEFYRFSHFFKRISDFTKIELINSINEVDDNFKCIHCEKEKYLLQKLLIKELFKHNTNNTKMLRFMLFNLEDIKIEYAPLKQKKYFWKLNFWIITYFLFFIFCYRKGYLKFLQKIRHYLEKIQICE